jgi:hypothetical protein
VPTLLTSAAVHSARNTRTMGGAKHH